MFATHDCHSRNLQYTVAYKNKPPAELLAELLLLIDGNCSIVYCRTRAECDRLSAALVEAGVEALTYHAGLPDCSRESNMDEFMTSEESVMVATIAFGMGIDRASGPRRRARACAGVAARPPAAMGTRPAWGPT